MQVHLLQSFSTQGLQEQIQLDFNMINKILKVIEVTILALIIVATARPQKIDELVKSKVEIIDILLVLDISSSMLADDFSPNRLEVVKKTAKEFIESREGDRLGILVFAGFR